MSQTFYLHDSDSDVSGLKQLIDLTVPSVSVDFAIPVQSLTEVESWITTPLFPKQTSFAAGSYSTSLVITAAPTGLAYTIELWRTDSNGVELTQIGSTPANQTGTGTKTFAITLSSAITTANTDRFKLKLLAANTGAASLTLTLTTVSSNISTPLGSIARKNIRNRRRGRFLGTFTRPAEKDFIDKDGFELEISEI